MDPVDLYLLGSGIRSALQLTTETIQALKTCRVVFVLHDDLMVHEHLRRYCPDVRDLADLYTGHETRADVYRSISRLLVDEAARAPGVAFIVHGHPLFLVSATEYTLALAHERRVRVRMLPAVSSFDAILCDLQVDYGYGLQIFDATSMLRQGWLPNPALPTLVFQLSTVLNGAIVRDDPKPESLEPVVAHLARAYPSDHPCVVLHSGAYLLEPTTKIEVRLADLCAAPDLGLWNRPTLYLPPVGD